MKADGKTAASWGEGQKTQKNSHWGSGGKLWEVQSTSQKLWGVSLPLQFSPRRSQRSSHFRVTFPWPHEEQYYGVQNDHTHTFLLFLNYYPDYTGHLLHWAFWQGLFWVTRAPP